MALWSGVRVALDESVRRCGASFNCSERRGPLDRSGRRDQVLVSSACRDGGTAADVLSSSPPHRRNAAVHCTAQGDSTPKAPKAPVTAPTPKEALPSIYRDDDSDDSADSESDRRKVRCHARPYFGRHVQRRL